MRGVTPSRSQFVHHVFTIFFIVLFEFTTSSQIVHHVFTTSQIHFFKRLINFPSWCDPNSFHHSFLGIFCWEDTWEDHLNTPSSTPKPTPGDKGTNSSVAKPSTSGQTKFDGKPESSPSPKNPRWAGVNGRKYMASWWFQPLRKILVEMGIFPKLGVKKKRLKPAPRMGFTGFFFHPTYLTVLLFHPIYNDHRGHLVLLLEKQGTYHEATPVGFIWVSSC